MGRIVFHSMAHRGDVFPYVALAAELGRRGHDVTYVVPREFHPGFAGEPFRCVHSGTDLSPRVLDGYGDYLARWGTRFGGALTLRLYYGTLTVPHLDELYAAVEAEVAGADLLVSHPAATVIGAMACERHDVPYAVGDLFPMLLPTAEAPPSGLPDLGRRANRLVWRAARSPRLGRFSSADAFVAFRRRLGLTTPDGWNVVDARLSPHLNLGLASPHYVEARPDWPPGYRLVGFPRWTGTGGGTLPDEVRAFLDTGPAPVLVTLGTSGASARPEVFEQAAAALAAVGQRGLFLTSNDEVTARVRRAVAGSGGPDRHCVWPFVPLEAVLPRVRGVVHSGAHGTNAMTLAAGLPSVVVPCLFDQRWHAQRQEALGTGVWARRPRRLAGAVERLVTDDGLAARARSLGRLMAAEDGTAAACDAIEAFLAGRS